MIITCPNPDCGKKFNWEPPKSTGVYKHLTPEDFEKFTRPRRYTAICPHCKTRINVSLRE